MSETPDVLYHYCSMNSFFNIIRNRSIWLSDVSKSNDKDELIWYKEKRIEWFDSHYSEIGMSKLEYQAKKQEQQSRICTTQNRSWVMCCSKEGDLLSQWRGYADDASGISIGFGKDLFEKLDNKLIYSDCFSAILLFGKVRYTETEIDEFIRSTIERSKAIDLLTKRSYDPTSFLDNSLLIEAPFYKSHYFSEEKEWRIAVIPIKGNTCPLCQEINIFESHPSELLFSGKFDYHLSNNKLISHFEIPIIDINNTIKEIVLGPKCCETVESIKQFLYAYGVIDSAESESVYVHRSGSSYR